MTTDPTPSCNLALYPAPHSILHPTLHPTVHSNLPLESHTKPHF